MTTHSNYLTVICEECFDTSCGLTTNSKRPNFANQFRASNFIECLEKVEDTRIHLQLNVEQALNLTSRLYPMCLAAYLGPEAMLSLVSVCVSVVLLLVLVKVHMVQM